MTPLEIVIGSERDYPLQCWNQGAQTTPTDWASGDTLVAKVFGGQTATLLFNPTVAWYTAGSTQTGYGQAQVLVTIAAAQSATLDYAGNYQLQVWRTPAAGGDSRCVVDTWLKALPAPGTSTQLKTYCPYSDLLVYAPWVADVQAADTDQEGFYTQRIRAREWLDWLIVRSWRGTSAAYFGDAGRSAQFWLGSWVRRTPLPSYWLINQLAGGFLLNSGITITAAGSGYVAPAVTAPAPPAGTGNLTASLSATLNGTGGIGSIYVNTQGLGYTPGSTITLTITDSHGTGATATALVSQGVLIVRGEVARACAYKAISLIGLAQIGKIPQQAAYGARFEQKASAEVMSIVAELDLNGDGIADLPIPINPSNTIFT